MSEKTYNQPHEMNIDPDKSYSATIKTNFGGAWVFPGGKLDEYDLKDELIRQTIMDTQDDVDKILEEIEKIDERLYEIQKNR